MIEGLIIGLVGSLLGLWLVTAWLQAWSAVPRRWGRSFPRTSLQVLPRTIIVAPDRGRRDPGLIADPGLPLDPGAADRGASENLVVGGRNRPSSER